MDSAPAAPALSRSGNAAIAAYLLQAAPQWWLAVAAVSLTAGLGWRLTGAAPQPFGLLDGLGAAMWLVGLPLAIAWSKLLRRLAHPGAGSRIWARRLLACAGLLLATLAVAHAAMGLLVAFDPAAVWFTGVPMDMGAVDIRLAPLLLRSASGVLTPLLLLSIGTYCLAERWLGRAASLVWVLPGLGVALPLLTGTALGGLFGPGLLMRRLADIFLTVEGGFLDRMVAPINSAVWGLWVVALAAVLAGFRPAIRPSAAAAVAAPFACAVLAGMLAALGRAVVRQLAWSDQFAQAAPDTLLGPAAVFLATACTLWLLLASLWPQAAGPSLRRGWPWLLSAAALLAVLGIPLVQAGEATRSEVAATALLTVAVLLAVAAASAALLDALSALAQRRLALPPAQAAVLLGLLIGALLLLPVGSPAGLLLHFQTFVSQALLAPDSRAPALALTACILAVAGLGLALLLPTRWRRRGIRGAQ